MKSHQASTRSVLTHPCFLFLSVVLFEIVITLLLISGRRLVIHDTFFRFAMQYYFLNNAVMTGEVPQWIPYLTQGTTAGWWHAVQGVNDILTSALFLSGKALINVDFLNIFFVSMFFNKLVLLTGTWLLSTRYFSSNLTRFFVAVSVTASSVWYSQVYFELLIFYSLPLLIYLFHSFLDTARLISRTYIVDSRTT